MIGRTCCGRLGSLSLNLPALIEEILGPGPVRKIRDEIEFFPETIDLFLLFLIEDQLHQRGIVAEKADYTMVSGAQQSSLILRIIRKIPSSLGDVECVRKN